MADFTDLDGRTSTASPAVDAKGSRPTHTLGDPSLRPASRDEQTAASERADGAPGQGGVRTERVRALRAALDSGSYQISTEQLAECLLEHMLRRGQTSRGPETIE